MRETGRVLVARRVTAVAAFAAVGLAAFLLWPSADASASRCRELRAVCEAPAARHRKAMAVDELRGIGSGDARDALAALAASDDDEVAILALSAIGRGTWSGCRDSLEDVLEDDARTDTARTAALAAWCRLREAQGADWEDVRDYSETETSGRGALRSARSALAAKLWQVEVSDE